MIKLKNMDKETYNWKSKAKCKNLNIRIFYPEKKDRKAIRKAKSICYSCDVLEQCRKFALSVECDYDYGIYGGLTRFERIQIRKKDDNLSKKGIRL